MTDSPASLQCNYTGSPWLRSLFRPNHYLPRITSPLRSDSTTGKCCLQNMGSNVMFFILGFKTFYESSKAVRPLLLSVLNSLCPELCSSGGSLPRPLTPRHTVSSYFWAETEFTCQLCCIFLSFGNLIFLHPSRPTSNPISLWIGSWLFPSIIAPQQWTSPSRNPLNLKLCITKPKRWSHSICVSFIWCPKSLKIHEIHVHTNSVLHLFG